MLNIPLVTVLRGLLVLYGEAPVWTDPLLPQKVQKVKLIPSDRTDHIEVVFCVEQVHRPLFIVIPQLSVNIVRGVALPLA